LFGEDAGKTAVKIDEILKRMAANLLAGGAEFTGDILSAVGHMRENESDYEDEDEPFFSAEDVQQIANVLYGVDEKISEGNDMEIYDAAHFLGREAPAYLLGSVIPGAPIVKGLVGAGAETLANSSGAYNDFLENGKTKDEAYDLAIKSAAEEFIPNVAGHTLMHPTSSFADSIKSKISNRVANSISEVNQQRVSAKYRDEEASLEDYIKSLLLGGAL